VTRPQLDTAVLVIVAEEDEPFESPPDEHAAAAVSSRATCTFPPAAIRAAKASSAPVLGEHG
jgi:hypothetical protein